MLTLFGSVLEQLAPTLWTLSASMPKDAPTVQTNSATVVLSVISAGMLCMHTAVRWIKTTTNRLAAGNLLDVAHGRLHLVAARMMATLRD